MTLPRQSSPYCRVSLALYEFSTSIPVRIPDFRYGFQLKKIKRSEPEKITDDIRAFLSSAVEAILQKMKWDDDAEFDDIDEDDKHTFEALRKVSFSSGFGPEPDLNMG